MSRATPDPKDLQKGDALVFIQPSSDPTVMGVLTPAPHPGDSGGIRLKVDMYGTGQQGQGHRLPVEI